MMRAVRPAARPGCLPRPTIRVNRIAPRQCRQYSQGDTKTTHFGFSEVPEDKKAEMVAEVFHNVAAKYDTMNDFMSAGNYFIDSLAPSPGTRLLDVAGGTGDIAFRFVNAVRASPLYQPSLPNAKKSHVTIADINPSMLEVGKARAEELGLLPDGDPSIDWLVADAENLLTIPSASFDAYTIAFGIRNCTHPDRVLAEAFRVLRPGGRFLCLEFSRVPNPLLRAAYDKYSFEVIPTIGQVVAGDRASYQYLVESIRKFPSQDTFADMLRAAGFSRVRYENLTAGVVALHTGFKL